MELTILLAGGSLLSLAFEYFPGFSPWFNALEDNKQRGLVALVLLLVPLAAFGLSCAGWMQGLWPELAGSCDQLGVQTYIRGYVLALIANQSTHRILPKEDMTYAARLLPF
jgi:hypothetical protein